jgi:hypothetical protein
MVLVDFSFLIHIALKLGLPIRAEQPFEHGFLNLLVIFILEEIISEELHRAHNK